MGYNHPTDERSLNYLPMTKSKTWKYSFFVGVDVSKNELDIALRFRERFIEHCKIANKPAEIFELLKRFKLEHKLTIPNTVFGMEHTGIYCSHLLRCLEKLQANIVLEDSRRIRQSLGIIRGKTDMVDAIRISEYLASRKDKLIIFSPKREVIEDLARLSTLRSRLTSIKSALMVPLKEEKAFILDEHSKTSTKICDKTIDAIKNDLQDLDNHIRELWKRDERLNRLMELITSIDGIGEVTALQVIIVTNEFKYFDNARKFACYCGVAPFDKTSGSSVRGRSKVSGIANKKMKSLLHICAMSACQYSPEIKEYYYRRTKLDGKPKMSILNAIRFKLITRIFTCVSQDRIYEREYVRSS